MHIEIEAEAGPRGVLAVDGCEPRPFDGWLGLLAELGQILPLHRSPSDGPGNDGDHGDIA